MEATAALERDCPPPYRRPMNALARALDGESEGEEEEEEGEEEEEEEGEGTGEGMGFGCGFEHPTSMNLDD